MSLIKISERFVLNKLKKISQGNLKLINYDGKVFHFGDLESKLSSDIKINKPNFYLNVIMGGSSALGEAHMKKDFYSSNLPVNISPLEYVNFPSSVKSFFQSPS